MEVSSRLFKEAVYDECFKAIKSRIANAEHALQQAREASQDDTKSSAGDKYETTREMMQQDIDRNNAQLYEAKRIYFQLEQCKNTEIDGQVIPGAIVKTSKALLYVAVSIGRLKINNYTIFAVSPASPIGQILIGRSCGDSFVFNGINQKIEAVY